VLRPDDELPGRDDVPRPADVELRRLVFAALFFAVLAELFWLELLRRDLDPARAPVLLRWLPSGGLSEPSSSSPSSFFATPTAAGTASPTAAAAATLLPVDIT